MVESNSEYRTQEEKNEGLKPEPPAGPEYEKIMYKGLIHACANDNVYLRGHQRVV